MANTPFKMKYTNGKKADASAFPFSTRVNNPVSMVPTGGDAADDVKDMITAKIDEKVENKIDEVVNQQTNEGLV